MSWALPSLLAVAALAGHFSLAVYLFNRLHALVLPRWTIKFCERLLLASACVLAVVFLFGASPWFSAAYRVVGWLAAVLAAALWLVPKLRERLPAHLVSNDTTLIDVMERLGRAPVCGIEAEWFARLPGNELLKIAVQQKTLRMADLPQQLDGLRIAHLSDLHMTGKLDRPFYDLVVDATNDLAPDIVVITGDILEKERCLEWLAPTLGRLEARYGKFFILGNHELRLRDAGRLRAALEDCGIVDLGGRAARLAMNGAHVALAGNERPWFDFREDLDSEFRIQNPEGGTSSARSAHSACDHSAFCMLPSEFRILLSHSPDQLPWARRHQFHLMLAGHNHGGQIRLPYLGALVTPSLYGSRYAGGLYHVPPTLLHVSRGLAGVHLIRLNCPPELALLVLRSGQGGSGQ